MAAKKRVDAVAGLVGRPDFAPLAEAFKRVVNIVKEGVDTPVSAEYFQDPAEGALYQAVQSVSGEVAQAAGVQVMTWSAKARLRCSTQPRGSWHGLFPGKRCAWIRGG